MTWLYLLWTAGLCVLAYLLGRIHGGNAVLNRWIASLEARVETR